MTRSGRNDFRCNRVLAIILVSIAGGPLAIAQSHEFEPVTVEMLLNPDPGDWLMLGRTYDEQRFSPLDQISRRNVDELRLVWSRGLPVGTSSTIPIVYDGVMYVVSPINAVLALDATTGDLIWKYVREFVPGIRNAVAASTSSKSLAIYHDMIYYTSADGYLIALDAHNGKVRWEVESYEEESGGKNTSAPIVVEGKVITARACRDYANCFIAAHDAMTGAEVWKFHTSAAEGEPGGDSWGKVATAERVSSPWGLPGSYDPARGLIYWGIANPQPYTRLSRHGSPDGTSRFAPADLYSNSTVALRAATGELAWYYQHLPGDDWDADHTHERVLVHTKLNPDPDAVKWISPGIEPGEERDVLVHIGEAGGLWLLDRDDGGFLWATPFPVDVPAFNIANIDVETGRTEINWDNVFKRDKQSVITCFHNTRGYWPMAYHPKTNAIYVAFHDYCLGMTADLSSPSGYTDRAGRLRPGVDPDEAYALAKIELTTGKLTRLYESGVPGNGAVLATAGDLIFWGDMDRRFRAFDARDGDILWETILGGIIQMSTITYAVGGRQFVSVMTGDGNSATRTPVTLAGLTVPRGQNAIYVFALPQD
jgi:alcohol dehydrogenase (cytochrome c)